MNACFLVWLFTEIVIHTFELHCVWKQWSAEHNEYCQAME